MRDISEARSKRILVTGAAGFLGSFLCERLLTDGHSVLGIDNFSTGSKRKVSHLLDHPRFDLCQHDVIDPFLSSSGFDEIFNLACPASPLHYQSDPIKTTKSCVYGMVNMLELAKQHRARILQTSTSAIYGDPEIHPQPESYKGHVKTSSLRACYAEGKRCAETLCFDYHRQDGVPVKVARIFNAYGPRMDPLDGRVISNVIVRALQDEDITIYGDGCQTRSFCFVDDLIDGLVSMMATSDDVIGPFNLGNPEEITILELINLVVEATGSRSKIVFLTPLEDDSLRRCPEVDLTKKQLNWSPTMPLRIGLMETISYFDELLRDGAATWASNDDTDGLLARPQHANQAGKVARFPLIRRSQVALTADTTIDPTSNSSCEAPR